MNNRDFLINEPELLVSDDSVFQDNRPQITPKKLTHAAQKNVTAKTWKIGSRLYYLLAVLGAVVLISTLLYCIFFLPGIGTERDNPALNDIYTAYIEDGIDKTGATNFVTGMILDYRAFDTLGESFVLFTAVTCVLILLQGFKDSRETDENYQPIRDPILRNSCSVIVPIVLLFGIYVILNGSISPGGGFSGGAIMGAGLIIYAIAFGFDQSGRFFRDRTFRAVSSVSLLTYCASKTYSFLTGAMEAESVVPLGVPGAIVSGGIIFILNVCVGLVVTCTMFGFYSLFRKGEI